MSEKSIFVCPNPIPWSETYKRLEASWRRSGCQGDAPPIPLILSGWSYSSDRDKQLRWEQTIQWAEQHNCRELIWQIPVTECYFTSHVSTSYPEQQYGPQVHPPAERPSDETVLAAMDRLRAAWSSVAGAEACGCLYRLSSPATNAAGCSSPSRAMLDLHGAIGITLFRMRIAVHLLRFVAALTRASRHSISIMLTLLSGTETPNPYVGSQAWMRGLG